MDRASFLKHLFSKTTSVAYQLTGDSFGLLHRAEEVAEGLLAHPLIPIEQYHNEPKLLTSSEPPLYLIGDIDKNLAAISAICPEDGFLLQYLPQEKTFYCGICGSRHTLTYNDEHLVTGLPVFALAIKKGLIYITK